MNYISSHSTQPFDIQKFTCTYTICVYMYFHTDHELLINYMYSVEKEDWSYDSLIYS